jgi:predicted Zn-dependent peptidase
MTQEFDSYRLSNGMVVLGEPMKAVATSAFGIMIPCGASLLEDRCSGAASVISDWIFRGAANRSSRELSDAIDGLGLHRGCSIGSSHLTVGAVCEAGNLSSAVDIYADIVLRASLADEEFEPARQLAIEAVLALDDDPRQKVMIELRKRFYPKPLGNSTLGSIEDLEKLTAEKARGIIDENFNISESIFCVAGKYDFAKLCDQLEQLFGKEPKRAGKSINIKHDGQDYNHIANEGAQVHIGLMTSTVTPTDEQYYDALTAVSILSGGMSARLFTEVREKRGLCYAIGARYHGLKDAAGIACYAGTLPETAQKTADVIIAEFKRLCEGISEDELARAKVGLTSSSILSSESSSSRCSAIGSDYYILGHIRSLDEIKEAIDRVSVKSVMEYLDGHSFEKFTAVSIGPKAIEV